MSCVQLCEFWKRVPSCIFDSRAVCENILLKLHNHAKQRLRSQAQQSLLTRSWSICNAATASSLYNQLTLETFHHNADTSGLHLCIALNVYILEISITHIFISRPRSVAGGRKVHQGQAAELQRHARAWQPLGHLQPNHTAAQGHYSGGHECSETSVQAQ
jgi:hypothetical protein